MDAATVVETVKAEKRVRPKQRLPRGRVTVFPNWCKGCGLCVEFCPTGVLEQGPDGRVVVAHPEKCTACRWCELHCPDFAIFVTDIEPPSSQGGAGEGGAMTPSQTAKKLPPASGGAGERSAMTPSQTAKKLPLASGGPGGVLMQGDAACAEGAIAAGCRFFAGYPITPATEIAEILARRLPQVGGKFIQMEDEIASIAAIIGASVGGAKAMTATSGPGFSLMQENIGYAVMTEIPCVVVDVQRLGPSTGRPTSPSQGDVMQARWGTHGDHPIIVLSPSSVRETFDLTVQAFNFSERYRTPVILLMDEIVGHMRERVELPAPDTIERVELPGTTVPPEWYKPFENFPSDVPPLVPFGEGYRYHITGLHHDERGYPTNRLDEVQPWLERIFRKIERNLSDILLYDEDGIEDADTLVIAYGATARSARHAIEMARERGRKVGFLKLKTIWPFAEEVVEHAAARLHRVVVPEMNLGQLVLEVERVVERHKVHRVTRAGGEMVQPGEILAAIEEWAR